MINFTNFTLENGLRVYVHEDTTVPLAAFNLLYDVGSKDEKEDKTGFAHLFEHLMFGGSANIPIFDVPLQNVGGDNNAFTSVDITDYYITLPANNIETAFWLESDRMLSLSFEEKALETQRKVVIEEFKQRYLSQPYGDIWLRLRPLAYKKHPYRWATIGKDISHIENATMEDVKDFFYQFYRPNNAILCVAGNVTENQIRHLADKWFAPIPAGKPNKRNLPQEDPQKEARFLEVEADVPVDALYKVYHCCHRLSKDYHATDLISDVLGRGKSSRLYRILVKEKELFNNINAYITGSMDNGLLVVEGRVNPKHTLQEANEALEDVIETLRHQKTEESELTKVKNQAESSLIFSEIQLMNRAMSLSYFAALGRAEEVNKEAEKIQAVTPEDILRVAQQILAPENCSTMYYKAKNRQ